MIIVEECDLVETLVEQSIQVDNCFPKLFELEILRNDSSSIWIKRTEVRERKTNFEINLHQEFVSVVMNLSNETRENNCVKVHHLMDDFRIYPMMMFDQNVDRHRVE